MPLPSSTFLLPPFFGVGGSLLPPLPIPLLHLGRKSGATAVALKGSSCKHSNAFPMGFRSLSLSLFLLATKSFFFLLSRVNVEVCDWIAVFVWGAE